MAIEALAARNPDSAELQSLAKRASLQQLG
jgi:hypothetical protein